MIGLDIFLMLSLEKKNYFFYDTRISPIELGGLVFAENYLPRPTVFAETMKRQKEFPEIEILTVKRFDTNGFSNTSHAYFPRLTCVTFAPARHGIDKFLVSLSTPMFCNRSKSCVYP